MVVKKDASVVKERRKGARASRVVAMRHRLVMRKARKIDDVWSLSTTRNMSTSGALFMSPVEYKPGDILDLEIVMSGVIDIYKGLAEVVRISTQSAASFGVAVKYVVGKEKKLPSKHAKVPIKK